MVRGHHVKNISQMSISSQPIALNISALAMHCHRAGRKDIMKTKLLAMMLLAGSAMFAETRLSIGVGFGEHGGGYYQSAPYYASNIPPCPGPGYTWVDGYWSQDYGRRVWVDGYWYRQPVISSYQVGPRFDNRFHDRDDYRGESRRFDDDRDRGYDRGRDFRGRDRDRSNGRDHREGHGYENGFRGR